MIERSKKYKRRTGAHEKNAPCKNSQGVQKGIGGVNKGIKKAFMQA